MDVDVYVTTSGLIPRELSLGRMEGGEFHPSPSLKKAMKNPKVVEEFRRSLRVTEIADKLLKTLSNENISNQSAISILEIAQRKIASTIQVENQKVLSSKFTYAECVERG